MERRKHPRNIENIEVKFSIEDKSIICKIQNLSESGALLQIESAEKDKISQDDIGKEVSIEFQDSEQQNIIGRIIRVIDEEEIKYFAVFFLKQ